MRTPESHRRVLLTLGLLVALATGGIASRPLAVASASNLAISGLSASAATVPLYDKFELTFNVDNTVATNLQFPYDPAPPPGLPGRIGVTVEGLFLPPGETDWQRALRQPGFLYQPYERRLINNTEWLHPNGPPVWKVRFAPKTQGAWQYRVRVQDASLCPAGVNPCTAWVQSNTGSFTAGPPRPGNHGFIEVSKTDPRYFAFSSGKLFLGQGHGTSFDKLRMTYDAEEQFNRYSANGVDFIRVWMSGTNIAGSAWGPWVWMGGPGYGGYLPDPGLNVAPAGSGYDFTFHLSHQANRLCLFNGFTQGPIAVKPNTTYRLAVTATVNNITGPRNAAVPDYGLAVKLGPWASNCPDDLNSTASLVPSLRIPGWTTLEGTIRTGSSQYFLDNLYLMLANTTAGEAHVSRVALREVLPDGTLGPDVIAKGQSDAHLDFNPLRSWDWDYVLDQAAQQGVYLKLVVLEKNDRLWNSIKPDGTTALSEDNNNFYAAPNTKVRRLHEYFWRYLAARWGYSTAVHSWELLNEGDPFNGNHYEQANSFARYMHQNEPSRHLVTTSFWHSFPVGEFWGNSRYPDVDYADLHAYISTGIGNYEWSPPSGASLETDPAKTYGGSAGALRVPAGVTSGSTGIWIRGRGDWRISAMVRAEGLTGSCPYGAPASLAGPQILVGIDSPNTRVIPYDPQQPDAYWLCTAPAGTYGYTAVSGVVPVADDQWHRLNITFLTRYATSGTAWFDNLQIVSPDGRAARLLGSGSFDDRERMDYDTALYTEVYGALDGAKSVSGAGKPVVRGEAGIDYAGGPQTELPGLASDTRGVWLHNYLWGKLAPGGLYELYWWTDNIVQKNLYFQYKPVRDFLANIPLNNGRYQDARAVPSAAGVRAIGQIDAGAGRGHLWIQNKRHTWQNVISGVNPGRLSGTVTVPGFLAGRSYAVEWWQFDSAGALTIVSRTATADSGGNLILDLSVLPATVTDAAVKIGDYTYPYSQTLTPVVK